MFLKRIAPRQLGLLGLILGVGLGTAACTDGYGYSGVAVGYGNGGYYGDAYGYADPYYGGYGYGAYPSYFGWYGDYYYPGTGIYVYDQYRRPYRWNDNQRRYWEGRRNGWRGDRNFRNDWNGFDRRDGVRDGVPGRGGWDGNRGQYRGQDRPQFQGQNPDRDQYRRQWRGDRPNFVRPQGDATPRAVQPGTGQPRSWGGNRGQWRGRRSN